MSYFDLITPEMDQQMINRLLAHIKATEDDMVRTAAELYDNATDPELPQSMDTESRYYRRQAWSPIALCAMIVDKISAMLYSRPIERTTGDEDMDSQFAQPWRQMPRLMLRISKIASLYGAGLIRLRPDRQYGIGYSTYIPGDFQPIFDPQDPHGQMVGVVYDYLRESVESQIAGATSGGWQLQRVKEVMTRHRRDYKGEIINPGVHVRFIDDDRDEELFAENEGYNPLGDYLDSMLWRGSDHPTDAMGRSDVYPIMQTLRSLNELYTDANELLKWNLWPIIFTNDVDADIKYSPRSVVALGDTPGGKDAFLRRLEWGNIGQTRGWREIVDRLLGLIHQSSRVPAVAVGDMEHIGSLASGRAYEIAMTPLLELVREKERVAMEQEEWLMQVTLAMMSYYDMTDGLGTAHPFLSLETPDLDTVRERLTDATVDFAPVPLTKDAAAEAQRHNMLIGAGVESAETAIRDLHPDWTDEQVTKELERVGADEAELTDATAEERIRQQQERLSAESE